MARNIEPLKVTEMSDEHLRAVIFRCNTYVPFGPDFEAIAAAYKDQAAAELTRRAAERLRATVHATYNQQRFQSVIEGVN